MLGITVCVAAGDDGSSDGVSDGLPPHVEIFRHPGLHRARRPDSTIDSSPKARRNRTSSGRKATAGLRADNGGSTGGGVSVRNSPAPDWQSAITIQSVNPGSIGRPRRSPGHLR